MMSEPLLIVIPALNAEPRIGEIVSGCLASGLPVVVIDDGSSDATSARAQAAGATVFRHPQNRGKGAALRTGFAHALAEGFAGVITLDADGQHLPAEIPRFVRAWGETGADLVIGSRRHLFGGMRRRRRAANVFSAWTISAAAGVKVDDPQSGFRLYSGRLLREVRLVGDRFDAESEVIVRAGRRKMKIVSIPIELGFVDGLMTSHYRAILDTLRIAWRVARTAIRSG